MQKSFIAIALALTFTCAFAGWSVDNYVKPPVQAVSDGDVNFTDTVSLELYSLTTGDLYLVSTNYTLNPTNFSGNTTFNLWYRKLNGKDLSSKSNDTANFSAPLLTFYANNYAISLQNEKADGGNDQIRVYQQKLSGGAPLPTLTASTNQNATFTPAFIGLANIDKTIYVFHEAAYRKVNVTNFAAGGSLGSNEFTLSSDYDTAGKSLSVAWGESLGNSKLFATWLEGDVQKESLIEVSKGNATANVVGNFVKSFKCFAYATDKKLYGELCYFANPDGIINYYVRTNTTSLVPLTSNTTNTSTYSKHYPYGPYLAIIYVDTTNATVNTTKSYSYDIWNLETLTTFKNRTQFLTLEAGSSVEFFRVTSGGLYTLLFEDKVKDVKPVTSVQVGLLLGSSYLASVFGFLLTIIAGLFLF